MAKEARVEGYASTSGVGIGMSKPVGHMDSLVVPLREITKEQAELFFGLGFGNGSKSSLEMQVSGHYGGMFEAFPISPATRCLLEGLCPGTGVSRRPGCSARIITCSHLAGI